jgi:hypothetical protein
MTTKHQRKHQRNQANDRLANQYRKVGIKAVAAAVKPQNKSEANRAEAAHRRSTGASPMNEDETRQFADKSTQAARESIERGAGAAQDATRGAQQSYSSAVSGVRELNIKLIEMAHANSEAVFELAHEIASAEGPADVAAIWSAQAKRQFELMTQQTQQLNELGQKLASSSTEPLTRSVNEAFGRGTK